MKKGKSMMNEGHWKNVVQEPLTLTIAMDSIYSIHKTLS